MKAIWALLWLAALAAAPVGAQEAAPLLSALQHARAQGCEGRPGLNAPLVHERALDRAAQALGRGQELQAALRSEGHRSVRAGQLTLRGPRGAAVVAQTLRQQACAALMDPQWLQVGWHQQGETSWIIFSVPLMPPQPHEQDKVRAEVLEAVNQARAQPRRCGEQSLPAAPPVSLSDVLLRAAQAHAADMAEHGYFSHTGRDGSQVGQRASRAGYTWRRIGENLAAGQTTAAQVVQGWLDSPGHCANLMQTGYTEMGLAYAVNLRSPGAIYWVQVLGTPR